MNISAFIKRSVNNILAYPVSTIQGLLFAIIGLLAYYEVLSLEEGGLWLALLIAVIKIFSNDSSYQDCSQCQQFSEQPNAQIIKSASADIGGGTLGTIKTE